MEQSSQGKLYSTADTALAAWLYSNGLELTRVDNSEFPTIFYFENSNPKLPGLVNVFQSGEAVGNITNFYRAYKLMLARIKSARL